MISRVELLAMRVARWVLPLLVVTAVVGLVVTGMPLPAGVAALLGFAAVGALRVADRLLNGADAAVDADARSAGEAP